MTTIDSGRPTIQRPEPEYVVDDAQLAAAAFLARHSGRTLVATDTTWGLLPVGSSRHAIPALEATRPPHRPVPLLDGRTRVGGGDDRLPALDGLRLYRFAHIDGRIWSNPAQYVRPRRIHPSDARGLDRSELGVFLITAAPPTGGSGRSASGWPGASAHAPG
jgi:hypothetical protein